MKNKLFKLLILTILFLFFINQISSIKINKNHEIVILNETGDELIKYLNYHPVSSIDLNLINSKYLDLLLFIEDREFYNHNGFNTQRIIKSLFDNIMQKNTRGASTITQQYIKNVYLNNSKTIGRKIKELYLAIKLEKTLTKTEILEGYLDCIYFGNNIYGLVNASKYYFNKPYQDINLNEMICFITLLNSPSYYANNLTAWNDKKNQLAKKLFLNNLINQKEYNEALLPIKLNINPKIFSDNLLYYSDGVINEFKSLNINSDFNEKIFIKTKYNYNINAIDIKCTGNFSSIAINKDGYIISCIGNNDYNKSEFNICLNGKRDIGSTIKPLLYYEALKCGYTIKTTHTSAPFTFTYKSTKTTIKNYGDIYRNKPINMKIALATSDNIYAIKTHLDLGMRTLVNHLKKYNVSSNPIPSLALGSVGMSLYDLAKIYTQLFTEGEYLDIKFIKEIKLNNKLIYNTQKSGKTLGNPIYFKQIKSIMDGLFDSNIKNATAANIGSLLKTKCYGKSGLTDYDSYMIGFNDDVLIAVWAGHINNEPLIEYNLKRLPKQIFLEQINSY